MSNGTSETNAQLRGLMIVVEAVVVQLGLMVLSAICCAAIWNAGIAPRMGLPPVGVAELFGLLALRAAWLGYTRSKAISVVQGLIDASWTVVFTALYVWMVA